MKLPPRSNPLRPAARAAAPPKTRRAPVAKRKKGGQTKWMQNLLVGLILIPMVTMALGTTFLGLWFIWWGVEALDYNRAVLAGYETPVAHEAPTLVPVRDQVSTLETLTFSDENQPVAFANHETLSFSSPEQPTAVVASPVDPSLPTPIVPTPLPSPTPLPRYPAVWISIPSAGISATVEAVPMKQDPVSGAWFWDTPDSTVGWHKGTGVPGEPRTIELNGHVRWKGKAGVFWDLHKVQLEDQIILTSSDGAEHAYLVRQVRIFSASTADGLNYLQDLENRGEEIVVATTCINWSEATQSYKDRLIVVAVKGEN